MVPYVVTVVFIGYFMFLYEKWKKEEAWTYWETVASKRKVKKQKQSSRTPKTRGKDDMRISAQIYIQKQKKDHAIATSLSRNSFSKIGQTNLDFGDWPFFD